MGARLRLRPHATRAEPRVLSRSSSLGRARGEGGLPPASGALGRCPRGPPREPLIGIAAAAPWLEGGRWDVPKGQGPEHALAGGREGRGRGPPQLQRRSVLTGPRDPALPQRGTDSALCSGVGLLAGPGELQAWGTFQRTSPETEELGGGKRGQLFWNAVAAAAPLCALAPGPRGGQRPRRGGAGGAHRVSRSTQAQRHPQARRSFQGWTLRAPGGCRGRACSVAGVTGGPRCYRLPWGPTCALGRSWVPPRGPQLPLSSWGPSLPATMLRVRVSAAGARPRAAPRSRGWPPAPSRLGCPSGGDWGSTRALLLGPVMWFHPGSILLTGVGKGGSYLQPASQVEGLVVP